MAAVKWLGEATKQRLRHLDHMLGMDPRGSERHWLIPAAVLIGTVLAFFTIGQITAAPLYVSLPNGIIIAFVMAGLAVACVSPDVTDTPPDDPPQDDDAPVVGSPGGPWTLVAHLGPACPRRAGAGRCASRLELWLDHHHEHHEHGEHAEEHPHAPHPGLGREVTRARRALGVERGDLRASASGVITAYPAPP